MSSNAEVAIVGAGLSGLALARALQDNGRSVIVFEARTRPGGRVLSQDGFDLGPAWVWPHNRRMLALIRHLGLQIFPQHSAGLLVFEDQQGRIQRDLDFATMGGALRVAGGLSQITQALADGLGDALRLGQTVQHVSEENTGVTVTTSDSVFRADHAVLALPPRLAAGLGVAVPDMPTWMAGHAKLVATYDRPFWRDAGQNGDAISHRGPLAEIHDASPEDSKSGALFGFALPGSARQPGFQQDAITQLSRLFGPEAAHPNRLYVKDWSVDTATATPADLVPPHAHPTYHPIVNQGRIRFAGTETAATEGGFLEGALEAAEAALQHLAQVPA